MTDIIENIKDYVFNLWDKNPWALIFTGMVVFFFIIIGFKKLCGIGGRKKDS